MRSSLRMPASLIGLFTVAFSLLHAADVPPPEPVTWVAAGSVWHYSDDGLDPGPTWKTSDLDATRWRLGKAPLGYGDGDEATVTRDGRPPHPIAAYFRSEFEVADARAFGKLVVRLVRDDGAVVYLNGQELLRDNMPAGEIRAETLALGSTDDENAWRTFATDATLLANGRNVLAVEVHQSNAASTDLSFDLELAGRHEGVVDPFRPPLVSVAAVDAEAQEMGPTVDGFDPARFRLERTGEPAGELVVFFSVRGVAEAGVDYRALGHSAQFKAGERTVDLDLLPIDDLLVEGDESVVLIVEPDPTMGPIEHYRPDPERREAKAVIHDNEEPPQAPQVTITKPLDGARFGVGDVVQIEALAVDPKGFIARLEFFANGERIGESVVGWPECVGCEPKPGDSAKHLFEWKGAAVGRYTLVAKATHRLVFQPAYEEQPLDPPAVSPPVHCTVGATPPAVRLGIVATRPVAEETSFPYRRLPLVGEFVISRTGDLTLPASVFVHFGGEAENGVDCERLPWVVTVPAGETAMSLAVWAIPDEKSEGTEKLVARLSPCPPRTDPPLGVPCFPVEIDPDRAEATVTICDDARCGQAPTLAITAPREGTQFPLGATIEIAALAIDPLGAITRVEFWDSEKKIGVSEIVFIRPPDPGTPIHHTFEWKDAPAGPHTLTAHAKDSAGAEAISAPVHVTVGGGVPLRVMIVKPLSGAVFARDETVEIRAVASAADGTVARLDIFGDGQVLGSAEEPELTVRWSQPPAGTHVLSAKAVGKDGQEALSAPVRILVRETPTAGFVQRELPTAYSPGRAFEVKLVAIPPRLGAAWAVVDRPPAGWGVDRISDEGVFDAASGLVKFGPFTDLQARTLVYAVAPPESARGRYEFAGEAALDGMIVAVGGDRVVSDSAPTHPADFKPADFAIGLAEVTAYAAAWKEGKEWPAGPVPIPLSYVTRAGQIWKQGEQYRFDASLGLPPECWVPLADSGGPGGNNGAGRQAVRLLSGLAVPGAELEVQIAVAPGERVGAFALEEELPVGWTFESASGGATFNAGSRQIRWGPFFNAEPRVLSYRATPPARVASFAPLRGRISFDGRDQAIQGVLTVLAEDAGTTVGFRSVDRNGAGLRLEVSGPPGQLCDVQSSTDLVNWIPHQRLFLLEDGSVRLEDDAPAARARFFRVRPVPLGQ